MTFEDHFSNLSQQYQRYRPGYPSQLFEYLASLTPTHDLAWDCGTGNGQAAAGLAGFFSRVIATDASREQIALAQLHPQVEYRVERAEHVSLAEASVDLVTVAAAVHWFDLDPFYAEVRRVLKPGGVLAVWAYNLGNVDPRVDMVIWRYYAEVLKDFWPERFHYLHEHYQSLPFPFEEFDPPVITMNAEWTLDQLAGFLASWSAAQRYEDEFERHPLEIIWDDLSAAWGDPGTARPISWPLYLRVGKISGE